MTDAFRPQARTPRGFADRRAPELRRQRAILEAVSRVYEQHGFEPLETSAFEYADALGKFLPDSDRPNAGVFALQDESAAAVSADPGADPAADAEWMALRYDHTAPLARFVAQHRDALPKPFRRYAYGPVWRNEKPGPGRYREFMQCDADTVGSARPEADAEIVAMAVAGLEAAGVPAGRAVLKISSRKLFDGVLTGGGVTDDRQRLAALRAIDKYDRLGMPGVVQLLGEGRLDESGDFTRGAQLPAPAIAAIEALLAGAAQASRAAVIDQLSASDLSAESGQALEELSRIDAALTAVGVDSGRAMFDPTIVRGLEYYTGAVFEADLLLPTTDTQGRPVRFGSVGGGGRYDDLVARFTGERTPATGFSFGVSRLVAALEAAGRAGEGAVRGPVVVIAFSPHRMTDYLGVAAELRAGGVPAEVYLGGSGMKAQMKYADRRHAPVAVILGDDEIAAGTVTLKDLDLGRARAAEVSDNAAWRAERPGQATVPRADMLAAVRAIVDAAG